MEIESLASQKPDSRHKLEDYLRILSVRHCLIVKAENCAIIHHARDKAGSITTRIIPDGALRLDPPGLTVEGLFPDQV